MLHVCNTSLCEHMYKSRLLSASHLLSALPDAASASFAMFGKLKVRKMNEVVEEKLVPSPDSFTWILVGWGPVFISCIECIYTNAVYYAKLLTRGDKT